MTKEPFLLVNLGESESKDLAQVISNDTARKILEFLSRNESATESAISEKMGLALSTVHYNMQALLKANLVIAEEFHYSEKGKEVLHYALANKLIIIAPRKVSMESFKEKLRGLLPIAIVSAATAGLIGLYQTFSNGLFAAKSALSTEAVPMLAAAKAAPAQDLAVGAVQSTAFQNEYLAIWFLAGSLFALLALAVWQFVSSRKK
jgi:DNA-binding transcriptional ArsR family regulator